MTFVVKWIMNHKKTFFLCFPATEVCTRIMREFNANYFKPLFLKKKEMSPNMCFAAVVFQTVQIALKTGREFLQLLVFSSACTITLLERSKQYIRHFLLCISQKNLKGQF